MSKDFVLQFQVTERLREAIEQCKQLLSGQPVPDTLSNVIEDPKTLEVVSWAAVKAIIQILGDSDVETYAHELLQGSSVVRSKVQKTEEVNKVLQSIRAAAEEEEYRRIVGDRGGQFSTSAQHPITKASGGSVFGDFYLSVIAMGFAGYVIGGQITNDHTHRIWYAVAFGLITFIAEAVLLIIRFSRADSAEDAEQKERDSKKRM